MLKNAGILMLVVMCLFWAGQSFAEDKLVIFSQCNFGEPYRAAQNKLMEELWAQVPGTELQILDGQADAARQISQIETAIRQEPDLLIVAPLQRDSLAKVMGQAIDAGIPTICLERDIIEPNWTTYIRSDNRKIGQVAGQFAVDYLTEKYGEPKGSIVEIEGMKGVEGALNRHAGFWDVVAKYPNIKAVHTATANWFQPEAVDRMTEALNAVEKIDIVYGHNDPMAYGAYLAAKEKGREKEMIFIGVDGLKDEGQKYVKEGILACTVIYPLCVKEAVEIGTKILNDPNFTPENTYEVESYFVTPESL
ncbi:sugar ABC transporter substrate-binding protein [candidate division KSB3 bacterium]|uniref:Sugar ABC transporter substrate-binding protein n=1 Tax=candidate division KSB3 bacterium TaxID=2044937 RepID=A0A2G6E7N3_9BACT|nr:MAG: sugar ABC transporter substrate-binding protein [candidate division KSB3 bacterium]PIE30203.1 MAG: sugar ABC transporter substrate-binding protein [candidate division KSB3 bacterium]